MEKIVHLIDTLSIGGAQTHLLTILKCFDRNKYYHCVYSLTEKLALAKEIENLGIKVSSLNLQEPLKEKKWFAVLKAVSKMLKGEKPDILGTSLTWSRIFGVLAFVLIGKKKIISHEHGDIYFTNWKYRLANFFVSLFIDVIIVPSNAMKRWVIRNYFFLPSKIVVMYNSILTDSFKPQSDKLESRKGLGLSPEEIVIGSVGTLGPGINKGMDCCIDAIYILIPKYKNLKLIIVGDGELRGDLEKRVKDLGLENVVKFLGLRRDVPLILSALDIFVLASKFEPCGIALIEAMSMEVPSISTDIGGPKEIIEDGVNGFLFKPGDCSKLANIIDKLATDERLRIDIGKAARKRAEDRFEAKKYANDLEQVYSGLLRRGI